MNARNHIDVNKDLPRTVRLGDWHRVTYLIHAGACVNTNSEDLPPLHQAIECRFTHIIDLLLRNGADVNKQAPGGCTPLHIATEKESLDVAKQLLTYGAETNVRNDKGDTPFDIALVISDRELQRLLIDNGADPHA